MMSNAHRFIFVHVPKTGGNSIQSVLLPLSDDRMVLTQHQDGVERFDVVGPVTVNKHTPLAHYGATLGDLSPYFVFVSARHPFDRAVSFYLSPHRWANQGPSGAWEIAQPSWSESNFLEFLDTMTPFISFVDVAGSIQQVDDIIRFETVRADFARVARRIGAPDLELTVHRNKSAADSEQRTAVMADKALRRIVEDRFAVDMAYLKY